MTHATEQKQAGDSNGAAAWRLAAMPEASAATEDNDAPLARNGDQYTQGARSACFSSRPARLAQSHADLAVSPVRSLIPA